MIKKCLLIVIIKILFVFHYPVIAQVVRTGDQINIDHVNPQQYRLAGITVSGENFMDHNVIIMISDLTIGEQIMIPGEDIARAVENIWNQGLFKDVSISATSIQDNNIFLDIKVNERPRISRFNFVGIRKADETNLREKVTLVHGDVVTDELLLRARTIIADYFIEKGFLKPEINITQSIDTVRANSRIVEFDIDRGERTRISDIIINGNEALTDMQIKRLMKETRERSLRFFFNSSKLVQQSFEEDKQNVLDRYNELGKRDATILRDTFYFAEDGRIILELDIYEGPTYHFRNIEWVGNTVYTEEVLNEVLGIQKGDVFNQKLLDKHLFMNPEGIDVSALYLDNGYLFFNVTPVEVNVVNDSIDLEIRLFEGKQAEINRVTISGNTKTNDHVVLREIRTRPGMLFSRSDIIRSQRDILQLGYFNQETINIIPRPNPVDGTVDIEYVLEETSSDQIELSGGWGAGRIIGTLGLTFNNFSTRNILNTEAWRPLPTGDGQRLSLRAQTFGRGYISYSVSFMEPWLGGKRPNALSVSVFQTTHRRDVPKSDTINFGYYSIIGASVSLAQRLRVPDDFFFLRQSVNFQRYEILNSPIPFIIERGNSNNLSYGIEFGRNSIDAPLFPRSGSEVLLGLQLTPPFSLFTGRDYSQMPADQKYQWLEYHKWRFNTSWYTSLVGDLILSVRTRMGFLGYFNPDIGLSPFERFYLGGDGMTGFQMDGREVIAMRGYANFSLTPMDATGREIGASVFNRFITEVRFPVSLNPNATIYALAFAEAGNAWGRMRDYNPFEVKRSAGFGVRIFLPMFGLLGLDWGYGFDEIPGRPGDNRGRFHFSMGQTID